MWTRMFCYLTIAAQMTTYLHSCFSLCHFHELSYFGCSIENLSVDLVISDQFLLPISRQSSFCYVHHLTKIVIVEQRIAIEAIALSSHAVERILNFRQSLNDTFEHFICGKKFIIHDFAVLLLQRSE